MLDVDYHHGNGTQQIFYRRDDVQYVSLHGDPARAYPYVSGLRRRDRCRQGSGRNLNLPLPVGADDDAYLSALAAACEAIAGVRLRAVVVVSLGVDTFHNDPISDLAITTDGFDDRASWSPSSPCRRSCCRRAATTSTRSATTSFAGCPAFGERRDCETR